MREVGILLLGLFLGGIGGYYVGFGTATLPVPQVSETDVAELLQSMGMIIGEWQSTTDVKFTRQFTDSGALVDTYDGAREESFWMLFNKDIPNPAFAGTYEEGSTYLAIAKPQEQPLYFKVSNLSSSTLEMIHLDRGNTLTFTRK